MPCRCGVSVTSTLPPVRRLARLFREEQLLDLLMLAGWYHAISFTANGARVACEDGAPRFADVRGAPGK